MPIKIALFDMDSTIIAQECIDELAKLCGKGDEVAAITKGAMEQGWDFEESLRRRIDILMEAGLTEAQLEECWRNITLSPGVQELLDYLHKQKIRTVLVSGGFSFFTGRIRDKLGFDADYSNALVFTHGKLSGVNGCTQFWQRIIGKEAKAAIIEHEAAAYGCALTETFFMGDGGNDVDAAKKAGISIAYHSQNKALRDTASYCIDHGTLADVIPIIAGCG